MSSQDYQYDEGGGEFPPYKEDFFQRITDVSWAKPQGLLYSGGVGMMGSSDGQSWHKMPMSVPAVSLAGVGQYWVGAGYTQDGWYSKDGAKNWQTFSSNGMQFYQVAGIQPKGKTSTGKAKPPIFAALTFGSGGTISISTDYGASWQEGLSGSSGGDNINSVSGCGDLLFATGDDGNGNGIIYTSPDGSSWSRSMVFGPGAPTSFPEIFYAATAAAFDSVTKKYTVIGTHTQHSWSGDNNDYTDAIFSTSSSPSFGMSEGDKIMSGTLGSGDIGDTVSAGGSSAAGGGAAVTGGVRTTYSGAPTVDTKLIPVWAPGGEGGELLDFPPGEIGAAGWGDFCYLPKSKTTGIFACTAYIPHKLGLFISSGGRHFSEAMSDSGIGDPNGPRGGVGVGQLTIPKGR